MELYHLAWVLAGLTGLATAGLVGNGWAIATGDRPSIWMLSEYSIATPLRIVALIAYAPLGVVKAGYSHFDHNPPLALLVCIIGLLWSFMQGVFILTTFFGFT